ncbi:MAG: hypothetical protein ACOX7O_06455 [Oscillospiraceae bacterium]
MTEIEDDCAVQRERHFAETRSETRLFLTTPEPARRKSTAHH